MRGGCDCLKWNIERIGNFVPFDSEEREGFLYPVSPSFLTFRGYEVISLVYYSNPYFFFFSIYINMSIKKLRVRFGSFNIYCMVVFGKFGIGSYLCTTDNRYIIASVVINRPVIMLCILPYT